MQKTKTWIILYALGIAVLVLSLCRSELGKPASPRITASQPGMPSETFRP